MALKPFEIKSPDGIPQWKKLYDFVVDKPLNKIITYDELMNAMGYDLSQNRTPIYEANRHLLVDCNRMLVNIRRTGYKIATPDEQLTQAGGRPKRAKRQLSKGIKEAENINSRDMTPQERDTQMQLLLKMQVSLSVLRKRQYKAVQTQEKAVSKQKEALEDQKGAQDAIGDLERQIEELKKRIPEPKSSKKTGKAKIHLPGMKEAKVQS